MENNPLNQTNYREINAALAQLNRAKLAIGNAERAGVNCDEYNQICQHYEERLNGVKQVYFSGKP